jgi:hypothetical protein
VVAREDQVVVGVVALDVAARLPHGVGRALEPVRVLGRLLGREDLDEPLREDVQPVGGGDVAVERRRVELRQDEDAADLGVEARADRDVDQAVLRPDGDGGLRAQLRQREQPGPPAAAEDDGEDVGHG